MRALRRDAAAIALLKGVIAIAVLASGFRAVSDDDFARVVIAEAWAGAPKLDPTGTSWLPFPFWLTGAAMLVFGRSLDAARVVALGLGVASSVIVLVAARWITGAEDEARDEGGARWSEARVAALAGAAIAAVFPWSARLGVATVPELPAAASMLLAMASLVPPAVIKGDEGARAREAGARRLWGALALFTATLSRYDAWPVAAVFAAITLADLRRSSISPSAQARRRFVAAAALAIAGPALWIAWNHHAHGEALHFLARVAAYKKALGGEEAGALARLLAYPLAMLREEPELLATLGLGLAALALVRPPPQGTSLARFTRPAAVAAVQIAALSFAMVKDGAPTHHPERAVLAALLLAALATGAIAARLVDRAPVRRRLALGYAAVVAIVTPALFRPWIPHESLTPRADEVAVGRAARAASAPGEKVLVEVADYRYFAVVAALGRPEDAELDRSIDPRVEVARSSFEDAGALRARIAAAGARRVIGRVTAITRAALGEPEVASGEWGVWEAQRPSKKRALSSR